MELRDLIVTPLLLVLVYTAAYLIRPFVTNELTRGYFFPALSVRILGAIAVGVIYQFYYRGGDTFAYHTHGSRIIWEALMEDWEKGIQLLFSDVSRQEGVYKYSSKIWYFRDQQSFLFIRIAAIFDLFTFSSYCGTAVLFALLSFTGAWMFFQTFLKRFPELHRLLALAILFLPTVVFWGSGIFKDSVTLAALGIGTYTFHEVFVENRVRVLPLIVLFLSLLLIFSIKKYVLLCFLPALLLWWFVKNLSRVHSLMLKILLVPAASVVVFVMGYFALLKVVEDDARYNVSKLAQTAKITAYDIRYGWGARMGDGSGYTLGELDGTWQSMIRLAPQAINVSLFRPYFWEVRNPLMLLSAVEGFLLLVATVYVIMRVRVRIFRYLRRPEILFCIVFALIFAFAVGVSTYNFGTLSRYKIPMMPFYTVGLLLIYYHWKKDTKFEEFEIME